MGCNCNNQNKGKIGENFNAISATKGILKTVSGVGIANDDTIKKRRDICRNCEFSTKHKDMGLTNVSLCKKCLCIVALKTRIDTEKCPLNLW